VLIEKNDWRVRKRNLIIVYIVVKKSLAKRNIEKDFATDPVLINIIML
jgi:hypothetical protein